MSLILEQPEIFPNGRLVKALDFDAQGERFDPADGKSFAFVF